MQKLKHVNSELLSLISKILVLGRAGYMGRNVTWSLQRNDEKFIIVDYFANSDPPLISRLN
jgi:UDP-glucose 4-epimerase